MNRRWLIPVAAVLAAVLAGGVAYSETKPVDQKTARAKVDKLESAFMARLARELGFSVSKLRTALRTAGAATLDDALRQGLITKDMAAFLKGRLGSEDFGFFKHGHGFAFGHFRHHALGALFIDPEARAAVANAITRSLGLTREQLAKALGDDKDLDELAASKKVSEEQIGAAVSAALKPFVDKLVKGGTLDRARADMFLEHLAHGAWLGRLLRLSLFATR